MATPKVSFVVPCYKLGHLLKECVDSILAQSFTDFEVLILNDKSPDNTAEVAESFKDERVVHVPNAENLGHLRNYNKGISLSRGEYIWLISADDYLRRPYVLEHYVEAMESHPNVGYACCPGMSVKRGKELDVIGTYGKHDEIVQGHDFLRKLLDYNFVLAASVLVRRNCYEEISVFPLDSTWGGEPVDMGWLGDWYLWCMFALHHDVAYFAEPMVCYREHDLSMTSTITKEDSIRTCADAEIGMQWMIRHAARESKLDTVARDCLFAIAEEYRRQGASKRYRASTYSLSESHFEDSLCRSTEDTKEREWIRARYFVGAGDRACSLSDKTSARKFYLASLKRDPTLLKVYGKLILLYLGRPGSYLRTLVRDLRGAPSSLARDEQ